MDPKEGLLPPRNIWTVSGKLHSWLRPESHQQEYVGGNAYVHMAKGIFFVDCCVMFVYNCWFVVKLLKKDLVLVHLV